MKERERVKERERESCTALAGCAHVPCASLLSGKGMA